MVRPVHLQLDFSIIFLLVWPYICIAKFRSTARSFSTAVYVKIKQWIIESLMVGLV